jgi:hypothetical protein
MFKLLKVNYEENVSKIDLAINTMALSELYGKSDKQFCRPYVA